MHCESSKSRHDATAVSNQFRRGAVAMKVASISWLLFIFLMMATTTTITLPGCFVVAFQPAMKSNTFSLLGQPATVRFESQQQQPYGITSFTTSRFWTPTRRAFVNVAVPQSPISSRIVLRASPLPLTDKEVRNGIDKVVLALRKDSRTNQELGQLQRVTTILGSGRQQMDTILAVRFNASFQKSGSGWSSIPLPFGLGQSNVSEGRGTMVGQVKASINVKTGKVVSCSVFRDLGYGRTFDLKV